MKKLFLILLALSCVLVSGAQDQQNWFDGDAYYTSTFSDDGIYYFRGSSADGEYDFSFALEMIGQDKFTLIKTTDIDVIPFRADFGASVSRYRKADVVVFLIKDEDGNTVWTLKKVSQNHRDALATQLWSKDQPVRKMLSSMVLNPYYFSEFSKTELRNLEEYLFKKPAMNDLESINLSLITSELKVPDFIRYNVGDLQTIEEAEIARVAYVDDARSFLDALESGAVIYVNDNARINLSEVLNDYDCFNRAGRGWVDYIDQSMNMGETKILSESVHNGRQLTLMNLYDVTIIGGENAHIVVDPAYAFVLRFLGCRDITIMNLTMGHTEEGYCTGGVIGIETCDNVIIGDCDLYGCGAYGLVAQDCSEVRMENSVIRDCSYGIMQLFGVRDITFEGCEFVRNREFTMVEVDANCDAVLFSNCKFDENKGVLFGLETRISLQNCLIYHEEQYTLGNFDDRTLVDEATKVYFK